MMKNAEFKNLYTVQYIVPCTLYNTLYHVQCTLNTVQCTPCIIKDRIYIRGFLNTINYKERMENCFPNPEDGRLRVERE